MSVRSRRLSDPGVLLNALAYTAVYTVPSGRTAIVRSLWLVNLAGVAGLVDAQINPASGATATIGVWTVATLALIRVEGLILNPGDALEMSAAAAATVRVTAFGSLLEGEPE